MQIVLSDLDVESPVMGNCSTIANEISCGRHTRLCYSRQYKFAKKTPRYYVLFSITHAGSTMVLDHAVSSHAFYAIRMRNFQAVVSLPISDLVVKLPAFGFFPERSVSLT